MGGLDWVQFSDQADLFNSVKFIDKAWVEGFLAIRFKFSIVVWPLRTPPLGSTCRLSGLCLRRGKKELGRVGLERGFGPLPGIFMRLLVSFSSRARGSNVKTIIRRHHLLKITSHELWTIDYDGEKQP